MSLTKCKCVLCDCPKGTEQTTCPDCAFGTHSDIESEHSKRLKRINATLYRESENKK